MSCIFLAVVLLRLKDTAAEADGDRNLINQELLFLLILKAWEHTVNMQLKCLQALRKWNVYLHHVCLQSSNGVVSLIGEVVMAIT